MTLGVLYQAVNVKAPEYRTTPAGSDSAAVSTFSSQILYTMAAGSKVNELPERFYGKMIRLTAKGAICSFLFSDNAAQAVNNAVAATDAGATSTDLGGECLQDVSREMRVPTPPVGTPSAPGKIYFARQGSGTGSVLIELASD